MKKRTVLFVLTIILSTVLSVGCGEQPTETNSTTAVSTVQGSVTLDETTTAKETTADGVSATASTGRSSEISSTRSALSSSSVSSSVSKTSTTTGSTTAAPRVHTLEPLSASSYYGLSQLKSLPNSTALTEAYQKIVSAVENCQATVEIGETLTESEILTVFYHYYADYPQHFWCESSMRYSISQRSNKVVQLKLSYNMTGETLQRAKTDFHNAVVSFLEIAATGSDEYERELLLHDALAKKIVYQDGGKNAHDAYGALVVGKAVCEGYARAFQYLLYQSGIQCLMAEGESVNPSTGLSEGHAWNVVRISNQYYHVDLTWDDTDDANTPVVYPYFNLTTAQINENHTISKGDSYSLPNCVATANNFHVKNGTWLTEYTVDSIARILKTTGDTHIYCVRGSQSFVEWFNNNHKAVLRKMNVNRSCSFNMLYTGNEVVVRLMIA